MKLAIGKKPMRTPDLCCGEIFIQFLCVVFEILAVEVATFIIIANL